MLLPKYSPAVICLVLIITGAVSAEDVKKAVGEKVSFSPAKFAASVTSFTWKQTTSPTSTLKVIEWDVDDGVITPNPRFKGITTVNDTTGQINIINLKVEHSGLYTIDINSKEQEQRFNLTVMEQVPKPVITKEESRDSAVVYLRCEYNEKIIWKDSSNVEQEGQKNHLPGEFIVVKSTQNPDNFYTCTLKNDVSEETSAPVYERDLFPGSNAGLITGIVIAIFILPILAFIGVYLLNKSFRTRVKKSCPCLKEEIIESPAGKGPTTAEGNQNENHPVHVPLLESNDKAAEGKIVEEVYIPAAQVNNSAGSVKRNSNDKAAEVQKDDEGSPDLYEKL